MILLQKISLPTAYFNIILYSQPLLNDFVYIEALILLYTILTIAIASYEKV